jgi:MFS transporter, DHA2 family, lincomycin resistance protein
MVDGGVKRHTEPVQAAAAGSSLVFTISLILAVINVVLSFFIKKAINLISNAK